MSNWHTCVLLETFARNSPGLVRLDQTVSIDLLAMRERPTNNNKTAYSVRMVKVMDFDCRSSRPRYDKLELKTYASDQHCYGNANIFIFFIITILIIKCKLKMRYDTFQRFTHNSFHNRGALTFKVVCCCFSCRRAESARALLCVSDDERRRMVVKRRFV